MEGHTSFMPVMEGGDGGGILGALDKLSGGKRIDCVGGRLSVIAPSVSVIYY